MILSWFIVKKEIKLSYAGSLGIWDENIGENW